MNPEQHNNYLLENFETERLHFRKLSWDDFDEWQELFISDDVAIFLGMDPRLTKKELTQKWFDKTLQRYENITGSMNVLVHKESNQLIGQCGLLIQTIEGEDRLEVGYSILPKHWKQGYAFEAANACLNHAFEQGWVDHLISQIDPNNIGSEKVALKNGMSLEKTIIEEGSPLNIFSINREKWLKSRSYG
ncbi:MAG: GNAT family N-acetyltransferase [Crocinitomicaceae bacterium]|nr:GNAT family N-acetyltransferase [Crocinitomicaceae bacterium]